MTYTSVNEPESFVFADAYLTDIRIDGNDIVWTIEDACVLKDNSQNTHETAMGIDTAEVIFRNYRIESALIEKSEMTQEQWDEITAYCAESHTYFSELSSTFCEDGITVTVEFIFENSVVSMKIFCTDFIVGWTGFTGRAWCDREKKDSLLKRIIKKIIKNEERI